MCYFSCHVSMSLSEWFCTCSSGRWKNRILNKLIRSLFVIDREFLTVTLKIIKLVMIVILFVVWFFNCWPELSTCSIFPWSLRLAYHILGSDFLQTRPSELFDSLEKWHRSACCLLGSVIGIELNWRITIDKKNTWFSSIWRFFLWEAGPVCHS